MGIAKGAILDYWTTRGARYASDRVWGPGAGTPEAHAAQVAERAAFIFETCPTDVGTVDYGCGIGMYTKYFTGTYAGLDLSPAHLAIAKETNPGADYVLIKTPTFEERPFAWFFDLFFTATVLQHCSDEVVDGIFASLVDMHWRKFQMSLYEFANPASRNNQTVGRLPEEYVEMAKKHFTVHGSTSREHTIHGAVCAHTMIDVEGL